MTPSNRLVSELNKSLERCVEHNHHAKPGPDLFCHQVPVPSRSPADAPDTPTTATAVQQPAQAVPVPTPVLPPGLPAHPHHVPTWTDLVQEEDGAYKQTSQHPELNTCLSATIKRANTNLVVFDAFPSLHIRYTWLLDSLRLEFAIRRDRSLFINAVAERADVDENYLNCLISMVITLPNAWLPC